MTNYLIYLSERYIQQTDRTRQLLGLLNDGGSVRPANFNVFVAETDKGLNEVCRAVQALTPEGADWFAAEIAELGRGGDLQFQHPLRIFKLPTT